MPPPERAPQPEGAAGIKGDHIAGAVLLHGRVPGDDLAFAAGDEEARTAGQQRLRRDIRQVVGWRINDGVGVVDAVLLGNGADVLALRPYDPVASAVGRRDVDDIAGPQNQR